MMEMGVLIGEHPALCSIPEIKEIKFIHAKKEVTENVFNKNKVTQNRSMNH